MLTEKVPKSSFKYSCNNCDYYTNRKSQYTRHLQTKKHNVNICLHNVDKKSSHKCHCGKIFSYRQSLSRHKKTCAYIHQEQVTYQETIEPSTHKSMEQMFMELMEKNQQLQEQIIDLASKPRTVNNNKTFNLNNFLNVDCKDAMNLSEFLDTLQYTFKDLLYLGEKGFVKSIENTFVKQLGDMEQTKRPIHCTDKKRKTMYVKDEDSWEKDNDNEKIASAIKTMNKKQLSAFSDHSKNRPEDYLDFEHNAYIQNDMIQQMCGYTNDTSDEINEKIVRNMTSKLQIHK